MSSVLIRVFAIALLSTLIGTSIDYIFDLESDLGLTSLFQIRGIRTPSDNIVIIAMDEASESELGLSEDLTTWRGYHSKVINELQKQQVKLIVFDLQFIQKNPLYDDEFSHRIAQAGNVIVPECVQKFRRGAEDFFGREECSNGNKHPFVSIDSQQNAALPDDLITMHRILPASQIMDAVLDHAPFQVINDAINSPVREARVFFDELAETPSLPLVIWAHYLQNTQQLPIRIDNTKRISEWLTEQRRICISEPDQYTIPYTFDPQLKSQLIDLLCGDENRYLDFYGPTRLFKMLSYSEVYQGKASNLQGKIVLIGKINRQYAPGKLDAFQTSFTDNKTGKMMGVEIMATQVANLFENRFVEMPYPASVCYFLFACVITVVLTTYQGLMSVILSLLLAVAYSGLSLWLFSHNANWLPIAIPLCIQLPLAWLLTTVWSHNDLLKDKTMMTYYDPVTNLANRNLFIQQLENSLTTNNIAQGYRGLLLLDIDYFKKLVDTQGYSQGDLILKQMAQRLTHCVRASDTVARIGGDEFMVLLNHLATDEAAAAHHLINIAEKINHACNQAFTLSNTDYYCTVSIGILLFKDNDTSVDGLMQKCEIAMYKAKSTGRNCWQFFDPSIEFALRHKTELDKQLRIALKDHQFVLHYQAQIANDGSINGAEVLLRWEHPQKGLIFPYDFISIAEESGLIVPLGYWVLESVCHQLALWSKDSKTADLVLAVNISILQFQQPDFVEQLLNICQKTGANPQRLKLELTESLMLNNIQSIIEKMSQLKNMGICFSLDDFGTGYSALSYLRRLPLDQLKIDQSFVQDILTNNHDANISKTIIQLGDNLGLQVMAEGVETQDQMLFLGSIGCHSYQGFYFSRPLPLAMFESLFTFKEFCAKKID